jgi:hypothetical protein
MWYIIIIGFLIIGIFFGTKISCQNPKLGSENNKPISINSPLHENDTIKGMFSRKQIDLKLKRLAETPPPQKSFFGAMCYKVAFENVTVYEYVCPVCGEKTVYKKGKDPEKSRFVENLEKNINNCRREIENVKGINIKLDEGPLCKHCSPKTENPGLCLLVNIAGHSDTTKVCNINYKDIKLIYEFLNDKLIHREQTFESPLKESIDRIKELLGLK